MRSIKEIAADMRSMAIMLNQGADELESFASFDPSQLLKIAQLFGGGLAENPPFAQLPPPPPVRGLESPKRNQENQIQSLQRVYSPRLSPVEKDSIRTEYRDWIDLGLSQKEALHELVLKYKKPLKTILSVLDLESQKTL